jgi:hypothetical protein
MLCRDSCPLGLVVPGGFWNEVALRTKPIEPIRAQKIIALHRSFLPVTWIYFYSETLK